MNFDPDTLKNIVIYALPVLLAITVHEASHAFAAKHFGDSTAYVVGRMTLNPLKHIDPLGTILIPLLMLISGSGFIFGWAKPVPVNFGQLRNPKRDSFWVAGAGPFSNLLMALGWAIMLKIGLLLGEKFFLFEPWVLMSQAGIIVNVSLMVLNLVPLLPLDGGRMLESLLPKKMAYEYSKIEPYGMIILIVLLFSGILSKILRPITWIILDLIKQFINIT